MPHPPRKRTKKGRKPGHDDSHSSQKPLKEQKSSTSPREPKVKLRKNEAEKKSQRHPVPFDDRLTSHLRLVPFLYPCQGNNMSVASDTSGETPKCSLASYPPRYIHKAFDAKWKENKYKNLWQNPTGWDIVVVCRNGMWFVHRKFIKEEAPGFYDVVLEMATTDGSQNDGEDILTVDLSAWHPASIGGLLMFLYTGDWADVDGYPPGPTNLRSVRYHVDLAAQAWTLGFPTSVREAAVFKINCATYQLNNSIASVLSNYPLVQEGYAGVEEPLYRSLEFLYQQESPKVVKYLMPIRAAVARLVDIAIPWLLKQPAFVLRFQTLWSHEPMYGRYVGDHHKFSLLGCLLPSWDDPPDNWEPEKRSSFAKNGVIEEDQHEE